MPGIDDLDALHCGTCDRSVPPEEATGTRTYGDLDPERWQTRCCPDCGRRLKTVFVGP
jgi:NAD-dependent SIR2 family protein deacetylase